MYVFTPENLIMAPLLLWLAGGLLWFAALADRRGALGSWSWRVLSVAVHYALPPLLGIPKLAVSDYKGVAYARKFPDSQRVYERASPFGYLEVYSSSYLHFAPGSVRQRRVQPAEDAGERLSRHVHRRRGPDRASSSDLPAERDGLFPLPADVLSLSAQAGARHLRGPVRRRHLDRGGAAQQAPSTSRWRRAIPRCSTAFRDRQGLRDFTGDVLNNPKVHVIDYDGRLYLAHTAERYDVIDLSLADSAGLSSPGGFAIVEKYSYTREAMTSYMRALKAGGILSVTLWNKEEPPKSVLKLYATMAAAAREVDGRRHRQRLLRRVELSLDRDRALQARRLHAEEIAKLREHTRAMSFDEIYYPGFEYDTSQTAKVLEDYRRSDLLRRRAAVRSPRTSPMPEGTPPADGAAADAPPGDPTPAADKPAGARCPRPSWASWPGTISSTAAGTTSPSATSSTPAPLTNHRPYFAAYVKPGDLPRVTDRLELLQDEWGYLLLWATLAIACIAALSLVLVPADLRLAHHLQPQPRQVPHHHLFRLPGRRLHHGRGGPDLRFHAGAQQRRPCRPRC